MVPRGFTMVVVLSLALGVGLTTNPALSIDPEEVFIEGLEAYDGGYLKEAAAAFRQAADAGHREALVVLAGLALDGRGVRQDPARAARLYRRAAENGDALAQLNLGDLYSRGLGVPRDRLEAHYWLSRAAGQGRQWPLARLREIEAAMTPAEVVQARRRLGD